MDMVHQALHHASDTAEFERNALVHRFHRLQTGLLLDEDKDYTLLIDKQ